MKNRVVLPGPYRFQFHKAKFFDSPTSQNSYFSLHVSMHTCTFVYIFICLFYLNILRMVGLFFVLSLLTPRAVAKRYRLEGV